MPIPHIEPVTGIFDNVRLDYVVQFPEPLEEWERSSHGPNYPYELAYLPIYVDGKDITKGIVPSTYLLLLFDYLLSKLNTLTLGGSGVADSYSDPWLYELRGEPQSDLLFMTIHRYGKIYATKEMGVPLGQFGRELIRVAREWEQYLHQTYPDELYHPQKGKAYRLFLSHLQNAERTIQDYNG